MPMIPTISELEMYLHDQIRAFPADEQALLAVEAWIEKRKRVIERCYPGRTVGALPFYVLFEGEGADLC